MEQLELRTPAGWVLPARVHGPLYTRPTGIVLPGSGYTPAHPLLHFTRRVLEARGLSVVEVWWQEEWDHYNSREDEQLLGGLSEAVSTVTDEVERRGGTAVVFVGKSLGTRALAAASGDRRVDGAPAVWLTPILTSPRVQAALERRHAATLVVAGTADDLTDVDALHRAEAAGALAHRVQGGDHSLEVGDAHRSLAVLAEVVEAVDAFVADHVAA